MSNKIVALTDEVLKIVDTLEEMIVFSKTKDAIQEQLHDSVNMLSNTVNSLSVRLDNQAKEIKLIKDAIEDIEGTSKGALARRQGRLIRGGV